MEPTRRPRSLPFWHRDLIILLPINAIHSNYLFQVLKKRFTPSMKTHMAQTSKNSVYYYGGGGEDGGKIWMRGASMYSRTYS